MTDVKTIETSSKQYVDTNWYAQREYLSSVHIDSY